jgi:hypothetical protein
MSQEIIYSYTRAQAIEDGVLVDVSTMAREAGFLYPVAVTSALHSGYIVPDSQAAHNGNSVEGRLWDVLNVLRYEIRRASGSLLLFKVIFTTGKQNGKGCYQQTVTLKSICGPGDNAEPVITIMLPEED